MPKDHALSPAICIETKKVGVLRYVHSVSSAAEALLIERQDKGWAHLAIGNALMHEHLRLSVRGRNSRRQET